MGYLNGSEDAPCISINPPALNCLASILPVEPLLLMGAGPVPLPQAVAQANSVVINHLGPTMDEVIRRVKAMARYAFQTNTEKILGVGGPSSAAMEMAITNLLWPGRRALVFKSGTFSARFAEMALGVGADVDIVEGVPATEEMARSALAQKDYDVVTLVQGETSCGVLTTELQAICRVAKAAGALVVVDAVCTLTTMPLQMDDWGIDAAITGGQKGLSAIPGVSLVAFSEAAWRVIESRTAPRPHWCLDAIRSQRFWGEQQYHYTAPVPGILALHEALRLICEETLEHRFVRHAVSSRALQLGIEAMGLSLYVPAVHRLNSVVAISVPEEIDGLKVREYMATRFLVEISGAFGLNILRIGQMGEQCRSHHLFRVLHALGMSLKLAGYRLNVGTGMAAMERCLLESVDVGGSGQRFDHDVQA